MVLSPIKVLIIDNYDSFTYNLAHIVRRYPHTNLQIIKTGNIKIPDIENNDMIIFSPGPDLPRHGNVMEQILEKYGRRKKFLGICLGLQAIYQYSGGRLVRLDEPVHGQKRLVIRTSVPSVLFKDLPERFEAGFYHSWEADPENIPPVLSVTAVSEKGRIMAIRHNKYDIEAVQFHPESIMTPTGEEMIRNWLSNQRRCM